MSQPLVFMRSVSKTYRRERATVDALRDVSLEVGEGEFMRLSGPSGSGKTTLLNLIAGLDRPDQGEIVVAGVDITRLSVRRASRYRAEQVGMIRELLDLVGLSDRSDHNSSQLSGGEQQRVAVARALANDPALVLADEPTGNLDDESARGVMRLLIGAVRERGRTLLLVTHERDTTGVADKVLELRGGVLASASA